MKVVYESFENVQKDLIPVKENLVDIAEAPSEPKKTESLTDLWIVKQKFSGMNSRDKIHSVRQKMKEHGCDCYVVTALDEIAWLLNSMPSTIGMTHESTWK